MRTFLAGFAIFLSFFTGAVALTALPAHRVLLDPDLAGEIVANALGDAQLRNRILPRIVPGYAELNEGAKAGVDRLVADPELAAAVGNTPVHSNGTIDLAPLQGYIADGLRDHGQKRLAATVDGAASRATVTIPSDYFDLYEDTRATVWQVTVFGGLATVLLYGLALLISGRRAITLRSAGIALLLSTTVAAGMHWIVPDIIEVADLKQGSEALAETMRAHRADVLLLLAPFAVVGVLATIGGVILGRSRQISHSAS